MSNHIVTHGATVRDAARVFDIAKPVHKDVTERLQDEPGAGQVKAVLERNKAERHLREQEATRRKYKGMARKLLPQKGFQPTERTIMASLAIIGKGVGALFGLDMDIAMILVPRAFWFM